MKILLIGINFGNYEKRIVKTLESQGHEVFYMYDTDEKYSLYLRILGAKYTNRKTFVYQKKMLRKMSNSFDRVIVIVGRQLTTYFLESVKENNPKARFILYLWDDVKRVENFQETKHFYDIIYSFDLKDCRDYGFSHLPLFFTKVPDESIKKVYDIYSAMFSHSERERIISAVSKQVNELGKSAKFFVSLGRFAYLRRRKDIVQNKDKSIVYISKPIIEEENYHNMNKSRIILDVQFSSQIGLTMRTIESLGMKNKIITTNPSVKYYDFYDENNVLVINRDNPQIPPNFFNNEFKEINTEIYEKYSLETWTKTLTGEIALNNYIGKYDIGELLF